MGRGLIKRSYHDRNKPWLGPSFNGPNLMPMTESGVASTGSHDRPDLPPDLICQFVVQRSAFGGAKIGRQVLKVLRSDNDSMDARMTQGVTEGEFGGIYGHGQIL